MRLFNFLKSREKDYYSQSGQDQFAYNLSGLNGFYLEIGAYHPIINSNTFKLEKECNWKGVSIEYDKSFQKSWNNCKFRKNEILWDNAFNIDYSLLIKQKKLPPRLNYLSCDIEPAENTFNILKRIINSNLVFDYISFEHDKYNIGDKYKNLSIDYLKNHNYKIAINDVYSKNKKYKIYETWFIHDDIDFERIDYSRWKKNFYKGNKFSL